MDDKIKKFIEENIELIENNQWEEIYKKSAVDLTYSAGTFTESMLAAGIHPEYYLKELPNYFLYMSHIKEFIIPNNILSIGQFTFGDCYSLTSAVIGDNVTTISNVAFASCYNLTSVTIPNSVTYIGYQAFSSCGDKLVINYQGTKEDWEKIYKLPEVFKNTYATIKCIDGRIVKKK